MSNTTLGKYSTIPRVSHIDFFNILGQPSVEELAVQGQMWPWQSHILQYMLQDIPPAD